MGDQLFRLIAGMNGHFACNDQLPADCDAWHQLRRHVVRMNTALVLVYVTLREERESGIPLTPETGRKLEGWARWGAGAIDRQLVRGEG